MFARSSTRAFSSTMHTACLPRSVARISAGTSGVSSDVRYTVILIARTSGSSTAWPTKRSTDVDERVVRVVHEDVALADDLEHVDAVGVVALQPRLGDRRPRWVAQLAEAGQLDDLPEVGEVEQALDLVDLPLGSTRSPCVSTSRSSSLMSASISRRTTSPKRRRRSSASTASSRSSASSETSKSASRVTRKTPLSTTSIPGKSA